MDAVLDERRRIRRRWHEEDVGAGEDTAECTSPRFAEAESPRVVDAGALASLDHALAHLGRDEVGLAVERVSMDRAGIAEDDRRRMPMGLLGSIEGNLDNCGAGVRERIGKGADG